MPTWARLAWINRERLLAAARALKWPLRTWVTLGVFAALGGALYWAAVTSRLVVPAGSWPRIQWVLLVVNVVGFVGLYLLTAKWFRTQDELRDELDMARTQIDDLRLAVHEHDHDEEFVPDGGRPEEADAEILPVVDRISTEEIPEQTTVGPATETFAAVRAAPISQREPSTVEREIGGRVFQFRG